VIFFQVFDCGYFDLLGCMGKGWSQRPNSSDMKCGSLRCLIRRCNFIMYSLQSSRLGKLERGLTICNQSYRGSMLWSQFSAIFLNLRLKIWRFSWKQFLWSKFCID
jgi:hypothetical protein